MSFRLYESAWVRVEGIEEPVRVHKDPRNPGTFRVADHAYDIDARPMTRDSGAPDIVSILSVQAAREAGLSTAYDARRD